MELNQREVILTVLEKEGEPAQNLLAPGVYDVSMGLAQVVAAMVQEHKEGSLRAHVYRTKIEEQAINENENKYTILGKLKLAQVDIDIWPEERWTGLKFREEKEPEDLEPMVKLSS